MDQTSQTQMAVTAAIKFRPGRFPQRAHGHPHALAGRGHWRPEEEAAGALISGEAAQSPGMPVYSFPASSVAPHPEARRDHGPVFPPHPGVPIQLDTDQFSLGGDALDHRRGVLQRKARHQPAMLPWLEVGGGVRAAAPPVHQGSLPGWCAAGGTRAARAGDRQGAHRQQAVRHLGDDLRHSSGPAVASLPEVLIE